VTANAELAEQFRRQADDAMHQRRVFLVASVALASTTTLAAARKVLADPELRIPAAVKSAAIGLLDDLTRQESP
jgi:hypothetical protein